MWLKININTFLPERCNQQVSSTVHCEVDWILHCKRMDELPLIVKDCNTIVNFICHQDTAIRSDSETTWVLQLTSAKFPDKLTFKSEDLDSVVISVTDIQLS